MVPPDSYCRSLPNGKREPRQVRNAWRGQIRKRAVVLAGGFLAAGASLAGVVLVPGRLGEICAAMFAISTFLVVCAAEAEQ